jgi:hypothetical protein
MSEDRRTSRPGPPGRGPHMGPPGGGPMGMIRGEKDRDFGKMGKR